MKCLFYRYSYAYAYSSVGAQCISRLCFAPALKRMSMHRQTNNVLPRDEQSMKPKDWPAVGLGRFGQFFDVDFQAEHLQAANEIFALQLDVLAIKVITAEFGVSLIAL